MIHLKQSPWPAAQRRSRLGVGALVIPGTKSIQICAVTRPEGKNKVKSHFFFFAKTKETRSYISVYCCKRVTFG